MGDVTVRCPQVRFHGHDDVLVGDLVTGGAIATPEHLANHEVSYAHLTADGRILRYGVEIGTRRDLMVLGEVAVVPTGIGVERAKEDWEALGDGRLPARWIVDWELGRARSEGTEP